MTDLDRLPPDQRAVLSLVLDRGKSYGEVAELLGIPEGTVRGRAHAALDALARDPMTGGLRAQSARPVRPRASHTGGASAAGAGAAGASRSRVGDAAGAGAPTAAGGTPSPSTPSAREPRAARTSASSRRAGALLLGAIVVVIVVAVVLISSSGGKGLTPTATATTGPSSTSTSTSSTSSKSTGKSAGKPSLDKTIQLSSTEPSAKASGTAYVLSEGGKRAFYVTAQGLPPSSGFFYAVWLYNSPASAEPLGRASNVTSDGRLEGGNPLPSSAADYAKFIVTRETSTHPSHPGPTVLSGPFSLH
ncbi:MAG TPA: sigma factor-like helix-turn-helix DNA-binding protein [Solirubrobacteraceae bacterium]